MAPADTAAAAALALLEVAQEIELTEVLLVLEVVAAGTRQGLQDCRQAAAAAGMVALPGSLIACCDSPAAAGSMGTVAGLWQLAAAGTGKQTAAGNAHATGKGTAKVTANGTVNGTVPAATGIGTAAGDSALSGTGIRAAETLVPA
jgi:hypothetical protein